MLLVRVVDGVLRLFSGIPADAVVSFSSLRVTGAFLVSASQQGADGEVHVELVSEVGRSLFVPRDLLGGGSGVGGCSLCKQNATTTVRLPMNSNGYFQLTTRAGERLKIVSCK